MREGSCGAGRRTWGTGSRRGPGSRCCADMPRSSSPRRPGGCDARTPERGGTILSMRLLRPVEYPANRPVRRWVFDVLVTLLAMALAVPNLFKEDPHRAPGAAALVVLVVMTAPLVARRIWPIPVFGWILAVQILAFLWDRNLTAGPALVIALYTVARLQSRRDALACAGVLELVVLGGVLLFAGTGWWHDLI